MSRLSSLFATAFRSLSYRNYRLYIAGQAVSQIGTWLQATALAWLVYRLTHSPMMLGLTGFCGGIPSLLLPPVAGVVADRWPRFRLIKLIQTLFLLQAVVLAALVLTHTVQVWHVLVLSVVNGALQAFDIPVRQSFVGEMVGDKAVLGNAIALNSLVLNAARLLGPGLAGVLIAAWGEGWCFTLNAASFLAILFSLAAMRIAPAVAAPSTDAWQEFVAGFRWVSQEGPVRTILLLVATVGLLGSFQTLLPIFAKDVFSGGAHALGFLMSALGLGSLAGAAALTARKSSRGLDRLIVLAIALFGFGLLGFAFSRMIWISWACLAVAGFGMLVPMTAGNTLLQGLTDARMRGRVLSFFTIAYAGTAPFGNLLAGALAHAFGAPLAVFLIGLAGLLTAGCAACCLPAACQEGREPACLIPE